MVAANPLHLVKSFRLVFLPFLLSALAVAAAALVAVSLWGRMSGWELAGLATALLLLVFSLGFYRYRLEHEHILLAREREGIAVERKALDALRQQLEKESMRFEKQRQGFESRLMTYHEWMEFPSQTPFAEETDPVAEEHAASERDRQVLEIVQRASDRIFEGFQKDRYSDQGKFDPRFLANDVIDFIGEIAEVYQPEAQEPLLQTSVEKLAKALNHISLQLLFQLEQLPLNLKEYSLAKAYEHTRTAAKFYQYYKTLSPYLPYANYTWQLGKLVLTGANPVATGTWVLGSEFLRRTGRKLSKHYVDRYTLKLIGEGIRIVGNEAAMLFDNDYRYRDPNWTYGVELAEMVYQFPLSRQTLQQALAEVGNLPLRNSYDRIYLYRCLALGRSPQPDTARNRQGLSMEQRHQIAERLERFLWHHVRGRRPELVARWMKSTSERLGVAVRGIHRDAEADGQEAMASCLSSLGAFLVAVKDEPPEEVSRLLASCHSTEHLDPLRRQSILEHLVANPPVFFDYPNLSGSSPLVAAYFGDLGELETRTRPVDMQGFFAIREAGEFYRLDGRVLEDQLALAYASHFAATLWNSAPERIVSKSLVFALIRCLPPEENLLFFYPRVTIEAMESVAVGIRLPISMSKPLNWLVGTEQQLMLIEVNESLRLDDYQRQRVAWCLPKPLVTGGRAWLERSRGLMRNQCTIRGGRWVALPPAGAAEAPGVVLPGETLKRGESYRALELWMESAG